LHAGSSARFLAAHNLKSDLKLLCAMSEDAPRLYLIVPPITDVSAFILGFEAALGSPDIGCVLLQSAGLDDAVVRRLAPLAQGRGIACLVTDLGLAAKTDCDGMHVNGVGAGLEAALAAMKPQRIVGVGGLMSRHDAMCAAEAGVDYVMFGGPGEQSDFAQIRERTAWWAEIFNPPCVAYARTLPEVAELARAGADFIALRDAIWDDPRGPAQALAAAGRALAATREPAV
jgi:thiamine-phosphate pyrophosphorylase